MNEKSKIAQITTLGLLSTILTFTDLQVATSQIGSASNVALELSVGKPASALKCNSKCAKKIGGLGVSAVRMIWKRNRQQQQQGS